MFLCAEGSSKLTFVLSKLWNRVSALHPVVQQSSKYACLMGDRKGQLLSTSSVCGLTGCFSPESLMYLYVRVC